MHDLNDTIAAMATAPGESGIGIIRVSGKKALAVADAVFVPSSGKRVSEAKGFTCRYGWVARGGRKSRGDEIVDEAILTVMRAPRSYTREDVIEINCHGGMVSMRAVLELVLENGCRLAEPGEFTRRAFLNGRIDLSQAEAVLDVIRARTDAALKAGMGQLQGELSRELARIRKPLVHALALLESAIDFPDDEPRSVSRDGAARDLKEVNDGLEQLIKSCERSRIYRDGLQAVICGKPNVGKSSLLNALLRQERSIVTPVAGTTRDIIEEIIDIRGIPVKIVDTAGILEPRDMVEKKAVARTRERIARADLIIAVFDSSKKLDRQDELLMRKLPVKRTVPVVNKIDRGSRIELDRVKARFGQPVPLSLKKGRGLEKLEEAIAGLAAAAGPGAPSVSTSLRHILALKKMKKIIEDTVNYRHNDNLLPECAAQNLRDACSVLDRLQGKTFTEDLLDRIFGEFCIGK